MKAYAAGCVVVTLATAWVIAGWLIIAGDEGYSAPLWGFFIGSTLTGAGALWALRHDRLLLAAVASLLTVAAPNFYLYLPNLALLVAAIGLFIAGIRGIGRRRATLAPSSSRR